MKLRVLTLILLIGFPGLTPLITCMAAEGEKDLVLGIFPRRNPVNSNRMFIPLANYLSEILNRKVVLRTPINFQSFWDGVEKREFDLVHLNQYHYVKAHKYFNYDVILKNIEFGEATIAGAIIVRKDTGISKVTDLKGKVVVFGGDKTAMQSYIVARYLLQVNGLHEKDYIESFARNPPNAIMSTFFRQSAAAGSGDKVLNLNIVKSQIKTNEMKYLLRGEQLPHLPWAIKSDLPDKLKEQIKHSLKNLDQTDSGKALLKKMRLDGFSPAIDADYDVHRKIILDVLKESY